MKDRVKAEKAMTVVFALLTALVVLTGSIAVPLLARPFYYAHIDAMGLTDYGLTREEICTAYDQMMDYCLGRTDTFSVGVLPFSHDGADHFSDVRRLFLLDLWVLRGAGLLLVCLCAPYLLRRRRPAPILGHGAGFWAAAGLGGVFLAIAGLAALDFDRAFVIFHAIFFPGKDNWMFDWQTDPIILFLPQDFFRNCALLILGLLLLWCGALLAADLAACRKRRGAGRTAG